MTTPSVDHYEVLDRLGAGGFGEVYRARHTELGREDAIKILHAEQCRVASAVARFVAEARAASKIDHPGIVRVFNFGELSDGRAYYVMELLAGRTLRAILDERGALPLDEAQPILAKLAEAIDAAHAAGVAHRDLKPENLFVLPDGSTRVIDFGLAKLAAEEPLTTTGRVMGSPRYMSPEQCRGRGTDARSDLYSFGAVAYHVLVGAPPFEGEDALALALQHLNDRPEAPSARRSGLSARVDEVLLALLDKNPERRPRPLAMAVASLTIGDVPRPPQRRSRRLIASGLLVAISSAVMFAMLQRGGSEPTTDPKPTSYVVVREIAVAEPMGAILPTRDELVVMGRTQGTRHDLATGGQTQITIDDVRWPLADGRMLRQRVKGATIQAYATDSKGVATDLVQCDDFIPSPDGTQLVVLRAGALSLFDIATGRERPFVASDASSPVWSPSGTQLAWTTSRRTVTIARVADGNRRELALPLLADSRDSSSVAFTDEDHILYCSSEGEHPSIRLRSTQFVGDAGIEVRKLDATATHCSWFANHGRFVVSIGYGMKSASVLDLSRPAPRELTTLLRESGARVQGGNAEKLLAVIPDVGPVEIDRKSGDRSKPTPCEGATSVIAHDKGWGYLQVSGQTDVTIRDAQCAEIGTWKLPPIQVMSATCRAGRCAAIGHVGLELHAWALQPAAPPRRLGTVSRQSASPDQTWSSDLSPDGAHLVATSETMSPSPPVVFSWTGEPPRTINLPGLVQRVSWGEDPKRFIAYGMYLEGDDPAPPYSAMAVGLDGSREVLWHAKNTWFLANARSPDGKQMFGLARTMRSDILVLEPAP